MKSIADIKRAIKVGTRLHSVYHREFAGRDENQEVLYKDKDMGICPVSIVQTTQFAVQRPKADGTTADSWMKFPTLREVQFNEGNSFTVFQENYRDAKIMEPVITYTIVD